MRSVSRLADVSINTVSGRNLQLHSGEAKERCRDESARLWRRRHVDMDRDRSTNEIDHFALRWRSRRRLRRVTARRSASARRKSGSLARPTWRTSARPIPSERTSQCGCTIAASRVMVAIYAVWCNFLRIHTTLRVTPAMAAGLSQTLMDLGGNRGSDGGGYASQKARPYKKTSAEISN